MSRVITEPEFAEALRKRLNITGVNSVTGPGRSGAIASVYASHLLGLPWIPYGAPCPQELRPLLIVDTARNTGRTMRKACRKYEDGTAIAIALFNEPPRVRFWYEMEAA